MEKRISRFGNIFLRLNFLLWSAGEWIGSVGNARKSPRNFSRGRKCRRLAIHYLRNGATKITSLITARQNAITVVRKANTFFHFSIFVMD